MCRGRPLPVQRERDLLEPGQRPHLLLAHVMRPAAAVHALAAAQHRQREERAVDLVGVEPVVGPGPHRDHRPAAGQLGVAGELPRHPGRRSRRHRGDRLLPGRRAGRRRVVVAGRPRPRQPVASHRVLRHQQVEHRGHQPAADPDRPARRGGSRRRPRSRPRRSGAGRPATASSCLPCSVSTGSTPPRSRFHRPLPASE